MIGVGWLCYHINTFFGVQKYLKEKEKREKEKAKQDGIQRNNK
jgi:hypothetical protein